MADPRIINLARILVKYSIDVQPEDKVALIGTSLAEPLLTELYRATLRAGGYPQMIVRLPETQYILLTEGNDAQLEFVSPLSELVMSEYDCQIYISSDSNTRIMTNIDPEKQRLHTSAQAPLMKTYMQRAATGELRWVLSVFPTEAYAQDAEMSLTEFEDFVYSTTFADTENPVDEWLAIRAFQQRLVDWLAGKKEVQVKGPNVDLMLSIDGRRFRNSDGDRNMPSGEIYTSPVEESVQGWIRLTYPAVLLGKEAQGVELHFKNGKVVEATAEKNEMFLHSILETDSGAKFVGEFAVGTNNRIRRFMRNILFDEKMGGTIHLALGTSFPELGGKNSSAIHWDMITDMREGGQIFVDGELFYESGEFKV